MLSLTAVNGGAAINVTWDSPVDNVAIEHYEVVYVVPQHPAAGGTDTSTTETLFITGLVQGVVYSVWVRAVSEVGGHAGEYSEVQSITTPVGEKWATSINCLDIYMCVLTTPNSVIRTFISLLHRCAFTHCSNGHFRWKLHFSWVVTSFWRRPSLLHCHMDP